MTESRPRGYDHRISESEVRIAAVATNENESSRCRPAAGQPHTLLLSYPYLLSVENSGLDVKDGLIDSPDAPLEQAYLSYKRVANAGEGWESNWAAKFQHLNSKIWGPNFNTLQSLP